jgi:hypothetical protein
MALRGHGRRKKEEIVTSFSETRNYETVVKEKS